MEGRPVESRPPLSLLSIDEMQGFAVPNLYIHHGYRPQLPYALCVRSVFTWNNETLCIWTHLLGFLVFVYRMWEFNFVTMVTYSRLDPSLATPTLYFVGNGTLLCFQVCMFYSAGYHVFCCHHSQEVETRWLRRDFIGITTGTLGCYLTGFFALFYCHPFWRDFYLSVVVCSLATTLLLPLFFDAYWSPSWVWVRAIAQVCVIAFGWVPVVHSILLSGGPTSAFAASLFPKVCVFYGSCILGFCFYVSKIPERLYPGKFDFFGHSHQIFHIFMFYTLYYWYHATLQLMDHHFSSPCTQ